MLPSKSTSRIGYDLDLIKFQSNYPNIIISEYTTILKMRQKFAGREGRDVEWKLGVKF